MNRTFLIALHLSVLLLTHASAAQSAPAAGDTEPSVEKFNRSIGLTDKTKSCLERGNTFLRKNAVKQAMACYNEAIRLNPRYASAYVNRGVARECNRDDDGAEHDFRMAIKLNPKFAAPHNNLGLLAIREKDAVEEFTKSIELCSNSSALYNRALSRLSSKDYDGALLDLNQLIELDRSNLSAYIRRALIWKFRLHYKEALLDYDKIVALRPNDVRAYYGRGSARYEQALYGADRETESSRETAYRLSIEDFSKAISLDPKCLPAYQKRGFARANSGNWFGAINDFSEVVKLKPNCSVAYEARALARACADIHGAIADLDQAILHYSFIPIDVILYRAKFRAISGDLLGSLSDYADAVDRDPRGTFLQLKMELKLKVDALLATLRRKSPPRSESDFAWDLINLHFVLSQPRNLSDIAYQL